MKKRMLVALLAGTLTLGLLAGCGNSDAADSAVATQEADQIVEDVVVDYEPVLPTEAEEAEIFVEKIDGLSEDFIKGADISTVLVQEKSGVVYYNKDGEQDDLFKILADAGVNYIRVRVWNDPYDKEGRGYGGGNNDVPTAAEIGRRAAMYGMKLCVDFHYSDFWADPAKQFAPKEWAHYSLEDKKTAIYDFTKTSLQTIADAGADIGMVQIGNEINNGIAGETETERMMALLTNASKGVRDYSSESGSDIKIAVHYTGIDDKKGVLNIAKTLADYEIDYDIFGVSYYVFWHGTMENMTSLLTEVKETYGKETAVMETSYAYTLEDGDCTDGNSVGETDLVDDYAASVQSQATCIRDVMAATHAGGGLGVFYWEPAWIPVGTDKAGNSKIWEEYGSGWASSYASKYDPNDAGQYYGGSSWDNQAMFDFEGHPLASLDVFKYVNHGTICEPEIEFIRDTIVKINITEEVVMPETVDAVFNDRSKNGGVAVTWDADQVAAIDTSVDGEYTINGTLEDGSAVTATVEVANVNWLENPGFEDKNTAMWEVTYEGDKNPTDVQTKSADAMTGENSFHFWSESELAFTVSQTIAAPAAGDYTITTNIQGGDVGNDAEIYLYAIVDGQEYRSDNVTLTGWVQWQTPQITDIPLAEGQEITVGVSVKAAAKGWGTMDDFFLFKQLQ